MIAALVITGISIGLLLFVLDAPLGWEDGAGFHLGTPEAHHRHPPHDRDTDLANTADGVVVGATHFGDRTT